MKVIEHGKCLLLDVVDKVEGILNWGMAMEKKQDEAN